MIRTTTIWLRVLVVKKINRNTGLERIRVNRVKAFLRAGKAPTAASFVRKKIARLDTPCPSSFLASFSAHGASETQQYEDHHKQCRQSVHDLDVPHLLCLRSRRGVTLPLFGPKVVWVVLRPA